MKLSEKIRAAFPDPMPATPFSEPETEPAKGTEYCVGGAIVMHSLGLTPEDARISLRFPGETRIAEAMQRLLPRLSIERAHMIASQITGANDSGELSLAWQYAAKVLDDE